LEQEYFGMTRFLEFSNSRDISEISNYFAEISNGQLSHVIQQATASAFTNGDHPRTRSRQFGSKQEGTACSLERLVHLKAILGK
jgi:HAMP domain-containing protein